MKLTEWKIRMGSSFNYRSRINFYFYEKQSHTSKNNKVYANTNMDETNQIKKSATFH